MPSASIKTLVNGINPFNSTSRDDLVVGDLVTVESVNTHTTYAWTLAYKPVGSVAAFSGSVSASSPGHFTVDKEGAYLLRLTADYGLSTESTQYVRVRSLLDYKDIKLVAAGEGYGGSMPVPVDQSATGWTDTLNTNIQTLAEAVGRGDFSGKVLHVDPSPGYGDYSTIQDAIDAAVAAGANTTNPYTILIHPGVYTEDLTLHNGVNLYGWPGQDGLVVGYPPVLIWGHHVLDLTNGAHTCILSRLLLANQTSSSNATLTKSGDGSLTIQFCSLEQDGTSVSQGPALDVQGGSVVALHSSFVANSALNPDRAAITQTGSSTLVLYYCSVIGPTGIITNPSDAHPVITRVTYTSVTGTDSSGFGIVSDSTGLVVEHSTLLASSGIGLTVHPGGEESVNDHIVAASYSELSQVVFDVTGIGGTTELSLGSVSLDSLTLPGGDLTGLEGTTSSTSLYYDNTTSLLTATNVQDALDEIHAEAVLVRSLDDAYNGGTASSGSGRSIDASHGSVQILDSSTPSDPPPAGNSNGVLEAVGGVRVGAIGHPEIDVDPNPYGAGPRILMGNRVVPGNIASGAGTAMLLANSTGATLYRNYHLRVGSKSTVGGGVVGSVVVGGGDSWANGVSTATPAPVTLEAGSVHYTGIVGGDVNLIPGMNTVDNTSGSVVFHSLVGGTSATLTAAAACANPVGVNGSITFATHDDVFTLTVTASETRAAVVTALNAIPGISAAQAGGIITITTKHKGANAAIYFLSATTGVNAALGGFDGQAMVAGTSGHTIGLQVSGNNEITIGEGGAAGPLIYNSETGKLTIPGIIDPTAIVFDRASAPITSGTEGAIFVSDGSGGLTVGHLYYRGPSNAAPTDISSGGGASNLSTVLGVGNTTGGHNIIITSGDEIVGAAGAGSAANVVLRGATASSGVADGGYVHLRPGAGIGGGTEGYVRVTNAANSQGVRLRITAADTFSIDTLAGGGMPLVYNASTGKLDVPGLIDPTGIVFDEASAPTTTATQGAVFVSDGSGGLTAGALYYQGPSSATPRPVSGSAFVFPTSTSPAQTAEGYAVWDTDDDLLTIGTGTGRKVMVDLNSTQSLFQKSMVADDSFSTVVSDALKVVHTINGGSGANGVGSAILYQAENGAGSLADVARISASLSNATSGAETSSLDFQTRNGGAALTTRWSITSTGILNPVADNNYNIGAPATRVATISTVNVNLVNASGDVNPIYAADTLGFHGGPGGASFLDVLLSRVSGPLWNMNVGLRVGGNVTRNENSITFGTTRTNNGGGSDTVNITPAPAIAGAGSAFPGSNTNINGSSAAATGPGNFSAAGGTVNITAGAGAAVNTAQINGSDVVITGGAGASGGSGGAANGGGVALVGANGVNNGNGGTITIKVGALNGSGKDGNVIFVVDGTSRTPALVPVADNTGTFGANNQRWQTLYVQTTQVLNASGDANPLYSLSTAGLTAGTGGASPTDVGFSRISGPLWNMNVGLRVGGNVTRNENSITFGTTRTNNGGGSDTVNITPAPAIAGAGSANPGSNTNINGSAAAATGPGSFAASGGTVAISAGAAAAINAAQANGAAVTISGGSAASGVGGGAAVGGGVTLQGAAGVANGNGGDIAIQPGQLQGSGKDGNVTFSINGASRTPSLLPRASGEGNLGSTTLRWNTLFFQNENSSGSKTIGFVSKVFGDSPYTVASTDHVIFADPTGGSMTVNLPAAASNSGRKLIIKHSSSSSNTVTLDANSTETIDGALTLFLTSYQSATIICDGSNWFIL